MTDTISIPASNFYFLEKKLKRLIKKANKYGNDPIEVSKSEPYVGKIRDNTTGENVSILLVDVSVSGGAPKFGDWNLKARVELYDGKNIVHNISDDCLDSRFREHDGNCEHCNKKRNRKDVYVFEDVEGKQIAVGRTCLRDYIGCDDPKEITSRAAFYESFGDLQEEFTDSFFSSRSYRMKDVITTTVAVIREHGWMSKSKAEFNGHMATAQIVENILCGHGHIKVEVTDEDRKKSLEIIEYFKKLDEFENDYIENLSVSLSQDIVEPRGLGLACSAVVAYDRIMRPEEETLESDFVGAVKERVRDKKVNFIREIFIGSGVYGDKYLYILQTDLGDKLVWFTGKQDLKETFICDFTVKEHKVYNNENQTVVTRLKAKG